ncbi:MAG TPA: ATP-binding protein [Pelomicrobium sp.]|nr:ATP-binding protein [Pelomicrobium sp.]
MMSLHRRVALSAALVLAIFVGLTLLALERAFVESAESARAARLQGQLYLLMAATDEADGTISVAEPLPEPRLALPGTGLYAQIVEESGRTAWRSPSAAGLEVPFHRRLEVGERRLERRVDPAGTPYFVQSHGVRWATGEAPRRLVFSVAEDLREYQQVVGGYRRTLAVWLGAGALLLIGVLAAVLRWGLTPLRRVGAEIGLVQQGRQERIEGHYPAELQVLTENITALLAHERARQTRLKNALADLAHSLKTPLAVLRASLGEARRDAEAARAADEQLTRMDRIVAHHLQRAAAGAGARLSGPVSVADVVARLLSAMGKVHRDKDVTAVNSVGADVVFHGAEDDLMEMLGNVIENAFKWCRRQVRVTAVADGGLAIAVEDDGPGIAPEAARQLLERGVRADETVPGHGFGLVAVRDIAAAYGGHVSIGAAELGGARVEVRLPG